MSDTAEWYLIVFSGFSRVLGFISVTDVGTDGPRGRSNICRSSRIADILERYKMV